MNSRHQRNKTILGIVIAVVVIALFGAGVYALEHFSSDKEKTAEDAGDQETVNTTLYIGDYELDMTHNIESYLLMGTDDSGNEDAVGTKDYRGAMADFLLLLVMDKTEETWGFLQIDRNTITEVPYVDQEGNGDDTIEEQICTAHWYGADPEQGCDNTVYTVSELLGEFPIDGYYSLHMSNVGILNHAVGGVEVTLDEDFSEADPEMTRGKTLVLTDEQAEIFVRGRMEIGDGTNEGRMKRQQQFMDGFKAGLRGKMREDSGFLNDLFDELSEEAVTDIPQNRISVIVNSIYKGKDLGTLKMEGETKEGTKLDDGEVHEEFYPEEESIIEAICTLCGIDQSHIRDYSDVDEDTEDPDEAG